MVGGWSSSLQSFPLQCSKRPARDWCHTQFVSVCQCLGQMSKFGSSSYGCCCMAPALPETHPTTSHGIPNRRSTECGPVTQRPRWGRCHRWTRRSRARWPERREAVRVKLEVEVQFPCRSITSFLYAAGGYVRRWIPIK